MDDQQINPARLNPEALKFLMTRRSRPAKTLTEPVPEPAALLPILRTAARTPDHGKLEPWRFLVLGPRTLEGLADAVPARGQALGLAPEKIEKMRCQFADARLVVCVIESPKATEKFPVIEQTYSAGAVCLSLLNAALASGWGANWLSGWASHDRAFVETHLGLAPQERVAGFIHIGTETTPPPERPRPDLETITEWRD